MIAAADGPYLFETSAENWLARGVSTGAAEWMRTYVAQHEVHVSAITVIERLRGYALVWHKSEALARERVEAARMEYMDRRAQVVPVDTTVAVIAAELMAMVPHPPTPPRRAHRLSEPRTDRLARWRFDQIIAATALATGMRLIHNNAADFEPLRAAVELAPERFPGLGPLELVRCTTLGGV